MNMGQVNITVQTVDNDTDVNIVVGDYGRETRTFTDPEVASEYVRDLLMAKWVNGVDRVNTRRADLVAQLAKAQGTLERSGAA